MQRVCRRWACRDGFLRAMRALESCSYLSLAARFADAMLGKTKTTAAFGGGPRNKELPVRGAAGHTGTGSSIVRL